MRRKKALALTAAALTLVMAAKAEDARQETKRQPKPQRQRLFHLR